VISVKYFSILLLMLSLAFTSCSKGTEEEMEDAILEANFLLSEGDCTGALAILDAAGNSSSTNYLFLQVYASANACAGGYSDLDFLAAAGEGLSAGSTDFLNSLATFDYSVAETTAETTDFTSLITGVEVLTAGGGNTAGGHVGRLAIFGEDSTQSLNMQALFMVTSALGKYVHFYGDANPTTGIKTQCVYTYTKAVSQAAVDGGGVTACSSGSGYAGGNSGAGAPAIRRACQGIVLYNQLIDLFLNTTLSASDDYGDLDLVYNNIKTAYNAYCAIDANTQATCDLKVVQSCVDQYDAATLSIDYIEVYLAAILEVTYL
jgi:hypothetical protein